MNLSLKENVATNHFIIRKSVYQHIFSFEKMYKSFEEVTEMYRNIFLNYHKHCKQEGWNLFDELKMIIDVMETLDEFGDDDLYTKAIDNILFESALLRDPNTFTIEKHKDYALKNR